MRYRHLLPLTALAAWVGVAGSAQADSVPFAPFSTTATLRFQVTGTAPAATYWSAGHGDITAEFHDDEWELGYHFGEEGKTPATGGGTPAFGDGGKDEYEANELTVWVQDNGNSQFTRPAGTSWDFTGVASGFTMYRIPATEFIDLPYVGFAAEDLDPLDGWGPMSFRLDSVTAFELDGTTPLTAHVSVWELDEFGNPEVLWSSSQPSATAGGLNTFFVPAGDHEHFNIGFSAPGIYDVTVTVSAVPEPASLGLAGAAGLGLAAFAWTRRRRRAEAGGRSAE